MNFKAYTGAYLPLSELWLFRKFCLGLRFLPSKDSVVSRGSGPGSKWRSGTPGFVERFFLVPERAP